MAKNTGRLTTGITGFDEMMKGGLIAGSLVLVSGTPGTCKSIFASQVAYHNALAGKKCLYLDLEQRSGDLEKQMAQFGWNLSKVKNKLKIIGVDSSDPDMLRFMLDEIKKDGYDLIVLDSLDSISSSPSSPEEFGKMGLEKIVSNVVPTVMDSEAIGRMKLKKIFKAIAASRATALLTGEMMQSGPSLSRDTVSEFLCDGIIVLKAMVIGKSFNRTIQVAKMRLTEADCTVKSLSIKKGKGISID